MTVSLFFCILNVIAYTLFSKNLKDDSKKKIEVNFLKNYIKIHPADNVAVALSPLSERTVLSIDGQQVTLAQNIPQGHKFALTDISTGNPVIKYGNPIGNATQTILAGSWIHTQNLKTGLGDLLEYEYQPNYSEPAKAEQTRYFQGFTRSDGSVGVRNEIWIIPTVGCVNSVASALERAAQTLPQDGIDGVFAFPHPYGCSQMGEDQEATRKILADLIHHPNAGGVLVLGLGCENSNLSVMKDYIGEYNPNRVQFLNCQDVEDEISKAMDILKSLIHYAATFKRHAIPADKLIIGMKCGGSDGLSGITANPTVGAFSDLLISHGGTTILTEVPEMFGAETILMNRCRTRQCFDQTVRLINDFKAYFQAHGQTIYENPSPGNKKGGISTLEDKSLGCVQKSGSAPVNGVLSYAQPVSSSGLNLLSAPGNDLVASTALAASGAQIVLFTTGRGTPFASPVPTIKISSNTALSNKKSNWIDFDCGRAADGVSISTLGQELFDYILAVASGLPVSSEKAGYHDMAIFKQGVTL